ncbi:D-aspartate oxidase-like [Lingula anatina]|uniref:D-aspartate oxidase-like n=1 Tax=Lingula anatina TaxID=7574 RepID=A0A1S3KCP6_LINAN|nr:D-aspartate oxidase-like [Lingula anatina]|eukprot:XP_013420410.1 D-aspartate oxidase-like [Lingula anatina]
MPKIAVIGGGVVGMSTAVNVIESIPGARVTVYAERLTPDTTSDGAAGIFRADCPPGVPAERAKEWLALSFQHYGSIAYSAEAAKAGISPLSGYDIYTSEQPSSMLSLEVIFQYRSVTKEELAKLPMNFRSGYFMSTVYVECQLYLPWLMKRFASHGGRILKQRVENLDQFVGEYDVVVNCAGGGNKTLLPDPAVYGMRGQLIRVRAPWVKQFCYANKGDLGYIIPNTSNVVLGGTRQRDNYNLVPNEDDKKMIWEKCCKLQPSLRSSEWLYDWVGVRPFREPLRLETETRNVGGKVQKVVHNYGHGSDGVAMSWGTAVKATELVRQTLDPSSKL